MPFTSLVPIREICVIRARRARKIVTHTSPQHLNPKPSHTGGHMGTISLLVSFGVVAMLYGRDVIEDRACLVFLFGSTTILALGGLPLWLLLNLPTFPAFYEATFRYAKRSKRSWQWILFILLPGTLLTICRYANVYDPPVWVLSCLTAVLLCLEFKVHCLPAWLSGKEGWFRLLNAPYLYSFLVVLAGQYAWFRTGENWVTIAACAILTWTIDEGVRKLRVASG